MKLLRYLGSIVLISFIVHLIVEVAWEVLQSRGIDVRSVAIQSYSLFTSFCIVNLLYEISEKRKQKND